MPNVSPEFPNEDFEPATAAGEDDNNTDESEALNQLALSAKPDSVFDQLIAAIGSSLNNDSDLLPP